MFYGTNRTDADNFTFHFMNAKRCKDVYADQIEADDFFAAEFSDPAWICPDPHKIEIYKNPFVFNTGINFVMVVNQCTLATQTDTDNNLAPYTSTACADSTTIKSTLDDVRISYKIMA